MNNKKIVYLFTKINKRQKTKIDPLIMKERVKKNGTYIFNKI